MTVTLELSDDQAEALKAQAAARGYTIEEWLLHLASQQPLQHPAKRGHQEIVESFQALRSRIKTDGMSIRELIEEGRRY